MVITWKSFLLTILIVLAVTGIFFLGFGNISLFFSLYSPVSKPWQMVKLSDGETFYGHINALSGEVLRLSDAYSLDLFQKVDPNLKIYDNSASQNFSLGGSVSPDTNKYVLAKKTRQVYIQRSSVIYWEEVSPDDEAFKFLK